MIINGADAELYDVNKIKSIYPFLDYENARFPIKEVSFKKNWYCRHDAVAWGSPADKLGVDIIQNCEVNNFKFKAGSCGVLKQKRVHKS